MHAIGQTRSIGFFVITSLCYYDTSIILGIWFFTCCVDKTDIFFYLHLTPGYSWNTARVGV
jgi:hypothetical protein